MKNAKGLGKVNDCIEAERKTKKTGTASVCCLRTEAVPVSVPRRVPPGAEFQ